MSRFIVLSGLIVPFPLTRDYVKIVRKMPNVDLFVFHRGRYVGCASNALVFLQILRNCKRNIIHHHIAIYGKGFIIILDCHIEKRHAIGREGKGNVTFDLIHIQASLS